MIESEAKYLIGKTSDCRFVKNNKEDATLISEVLEIPIYNRLLRSNPNIQMICQYMLNLGKIHQRIETAYGEENQNIPDVCLDDVAAIIENHKHEDSGMIAENLFDFILSAQEEAFRYGYYKAIQDGEL